MRFHSQYCGICRKQTLFLEKLVKPQDAYCSEMEDKCLKCENTFYVKEKLKVKL